MFNLNLTEQYDININAIMNYVLLLLLNAGAIALLIVGISKVE